MTKQIKFTKPTEMLENKIHCFLALCLFFSATTIVTNDDAEYRKPSPVSCCTPGVNASTNTIAESSSLILDVSSGGTGDSSFNANQIVAGGTTPTSELQQVVGATTGKVLTSTGATALPTFQALSANVQVFTTAGTGTYTPTAGTKYVVVEMVGGGGGSGGVGATTLVTSGGGGSGSYSRKVLTIGQIGASLAYTIGLGGSAGATNGAGQTGGTTSLAALVTAIGGAGSVAGASGGAAAGAGGALGTGGVFAGWSGGVASGDAAGKGSDAPAGFGTAGATTYKLTGALQGGTGQGFGSGAAGSSAGTATPAAVAGGTGAPGAMIITEYILA